MFERLQKHRPRFDEIIPIESGTQFQAAQQELVGLHIRPRFAADGKRVVTRRQFDRERRDDLADDFVLQFEDIVKRPVEARCPDMRTVQGVDQLRVDPHLSRRLSHTAFEHITHAQIFRNLLHFHRTALVGEDRIAGDDEQARYVREIGDQVIGHPVHEIIVFRILAEIGKRQDGDRGLVGQRQRHSIGRCRFQLRRHGPHSPPRNASADDQQQSDNGGKNLRFGFAARPLWPLAWRVRA